jgi:signal transduction histidine kinase
LFERAEEVLTIEDLMIERLIALALRLDQTGPPLAANQEGQPDRNLVERRNIFFLKGGRNDPSWKNLPEFVTRGSLFFQPVLEGRSRLAVNRADRFRKNSFPLSLAVARRVGEGIILILVSREDYERLTRQIIIQGFLEEFSGKGNILYAGVESLEGQTIGQAGAGPQQARGEKQALKDNRWLYRGQGGQEEVLEIIRPFIPGGQPLGRIRIGLSLKEVNPILDQARRNVIFMSLILMGLGLASLVFIFRLQGRHLEKIREMEEQIRLKEELSAMGQLAAGVAHEIKNPLNAIGLVVQRLQKEFAWPEAEQQQEYDRFTRIVRNEIDRVNRIINQFLMVAKPLESRLEEHSLTEILEYVLEVLAEEFRIHQITVLKDWGRDLPLISCDRFQLTQAFLNILNNGLEAMPDGGEITVSAKKGSAKEIEIQFKDTGQGIAPDELKKIFAYYYTTKEKGVGLGLAITQKMIRAHQGTLEVQSRVGQGTTVIVRLPLRPPGLKPT